MEEGWDTGGGAGAGAGAGAGGGWMGCTGSCIDGFTSGAGVTRLGSGISSGSACLGSGTGSRSLQVP